MYPNRGIGKCYLCLLVHIECDKISLITLPSLRQEFSDITCEFSDLAFTLANFPTFRELRKVCSWWSYRPAQLILAAWRVSLRHFYYEPDRRIPVCPVWISAHWRDSQLPAESSSLMTLTMDEWLSTQQLIGANTFHCIVSQLSPGPSCQDSSGNGYAGPGMILTDNWQYLAVYDSLVDS